MRLRIFDIVFAGRFLSPDNHVQAPNLPQNYNRYSYCLNNPLKYSDPSGELFWVIPNIGYSKEGGLSLGVSVVFGLPGGASIQVGGGYNFKSNSAYAFAGATLAMNTLSASYSKGGFSVGWTAGASLQSGLPISTNFLTVGVNYNISNDYFSGNVSAWNVDKSGWTFDPSVSAHIFPERSTNFVRGKGFRTNDAVLSRFVGAGNYQGAIDYFGFEGTFDGTATKTGGDPAACTMKGEIFYSKTAFDSYDGLYARYDHETPMASKF